ncbi:MAG: hypothetical protein ACAI44_39635, partial [Candidatus Sericytochromatia bacterium]
MLMTYGIWVALFLVIMVLVPVGTVIWMLKRHQHQEHQQLSEHYEALATFQQQLTGMETVLTQYQQQADRFAESTRSQAADLLQQQEDCLARTLRLKSELRETEARLPQLGDQLPARLEEAESQLLGLKAYFEQIEAWYKRLYQGVADSRTQLHQLQAELQAQPADTAAEHERLQAFWERLRSLQAETSPPDPLQYQQAIYQLQQDLQSLALAESAAQPSEPAEAPAAQPVTVFPPLPPLDAVAEPPPVMPEPAEAATPIAETPIAETPAVVAEAAEVATKTEAGIPAEADEPAQTEPEKTEPEKTQAADADFSQTVMADTSANFNLSQLTPEMVQALRQGLPLPVASAEPAAQLPVEAADDSLPEDDNSLPEDMVTETFLGQRGHEEPVESGDTDVDTDQAAGPEPLVDEDIVTETFLGQRSPEPVVQPETESEVQPEAESSEAPQEPLQEQAEQESAEARAESDAETDISTDIEAATETDIETELSAIPDTGPFGLARSRLAELGDGLERIEHHYRELEMAFVPEAWAESLPLLERSRYLAAEAQELLRLAHRLQHLPQAPGHRVQLNLRRLQQ